MPYGNQLMGECGLIRLRVLRLRLVGEADAG